MGLNDAQEMLQVAKEQSIRDERTIRELRSEIDSAIRTIRTQQAELAAAESVLAAVQALCAEPVDLADHEGAHFDTVLVDRLLAIVSPPT